MSDNQHHWKARNKKTGEVCSHKHHSKEHAMRCAVVIYGEENAGVRKWVDVAPTYARVQKNNQKRARKIHDQFYHNSLGKANEKKANKVKQNTGSRKHRSIRGLVRFDDKD